MGLTSFYICISFLIVGFSSNEGPQVNSVPGLRLRCLPGLNH